VAKPPEAIGTMKYCAYKTGFCASSVCMLLLKHALKLKRHTVGETTTHNNSIQNSRLQLLCNQTGSDGYFMDDVPC